MISNKEFNCPHCGAPGSVINGGATYSCLCRHGTFKPFDMHAPFDAPLRMRERQRDLDLERWQQFADSPEGKAKLEAIVKEAMAKVKQQASEGESHG